MRCEHKKRNQTCSIFDFDEQSIADEHRATVIDQSLLTDIVQGQEHIALLGNSTG